MGRLKAPQRREQLLEVATRLFAKYGFEATTTFEIAKAAGVTEPILYRHFNSKQELFVAIVRAMSEKTLKHWQERIAGIKNPADQLRRIAEEFPEHIKGLQEAYHVIHGALATSRDRKVTAVMREHYANIEKFFAKIISTGQHQGIFLKGVDAKVPAWLLINTGLGYAMIGLNLSQFDHFPVEQGIEFVLRGLQPK